MRKITRYLVYVFLFICIVLVIAISNNDSSNEPDLRYFYSTKPSNEETERLITLASKDCKQNTSRVIDSKIFGINTLHYGNEAVTLLQDLRIKWVRISLNRGIIEQQPGVYDWSMYDDFISAMQKSNIQVLAVLNDSPHFISSWDEEYNSYDAFVKQAVTRYKPLGVRHWEIFNEPNFPCCGWLTKGVNPEDFTANYALMLARSSLAIRSIDKDAVIVMGGLSSDGMSPQVFLRTMYGYGVRDCFDVFAYHPYGDVGNFKSTSREFRTIMSEHRDATKSIWFNEIGTNENSQRDNILQSVFSERNEVDAVFWFNLVDLNKDSDLYGLVKHGTYEKRSVYDTFKKLIQE